MIDALSMPVFGVDSEGCVTDWNRMAADISGRTVSLWRGLEEQLMAVPRMLQIHSRPDIVRM